MQFDDRFGRRWSIIDKTAIVSAELLLRTSGYPQPLLLECVILDRRLDDLGREFVEISIEEPNNTQAIDGTTRFEVFADQIVPDDD